MLKLKRHQGFLVVFIVVFLFAWAVWTFIWVPRSTPSQIDPAVSLPVAPLAQ